jgi:hypothetical protein
MEQIGVYKVRTVSHDESVIHVPKKSSGWFSLEVKDDGTLIYKPVVF